ncbi:MAG: pyrophosphohydrolase [Candidatus Pacebacteria bacterium]|nr:pyrophosphohydrolase [Candidatus Paceibacterota bacterium]
MLHLTENPTIKDLQEYVTALEKERGFTDQSAIQKGLLLGEEIGELFKAIRKHDANLRVDKNSQSHNIAEELADVMIYLCAIANKYDIDLEQAFREKEEKNKTRVWK